MLCRVGSRSWWTKIRSGTATLSFCTKCPPRRSSRRVPSFDVVGVGLNATDTLILLPRFPSYGGKVPFDREVLSPGGQVASAMVACATLGLRAKYIGTLGDDERGRLQLESLRNSAVNIDHVQVRKGCANQSAYIVVDGESGERTVLWKRPDCLRIAPEEITEEQII